MTGIKSRKCSFTVFFIFQDYILYVNVAQKGFPGGSVGKESACNVGDLGSTPGLGRSPRGGYGNPLWRFCSENSQGHRRLTDCSPWDCKELDTTEWLSIMAQKNAKCLTYNYYVKELSVTPQISYHFIWVYRNKVISNNFYYSQFFNVLEKHRNIRVLFPKVFKLAHCMFLIAMI